MRNQRINPYMFSFLLINFANFLYYLYYLKHYGYLPTPFLYDKSDTFMDLFNPLHWAFDKNRFTEWGSVYPPLNFFILKSLNFFNHGSIQGDAIYLRENSRFVIFEFFILYLLVPVLVLKTRLWQRFHSDEKTIIYFIIVLSTPMLFALERGNLIILTLIFLCLAVSRSGFLRALSVAILVNIKPYFFILVIYYIVVRNWKGFVACCGLSGFVFIVTGLTLGGDFLIFLKNILTYAQDFNYHSLREIMAFPSSISAFSYVINDSFGLQASSLPLNAEAAKYLVGFIESLKWTVLTTSLIVIFTKVQKIQEDEILSLLVVVISNLGIWVGGYTIILYFVLIPVLLNMRYWWIYLFILAILFSPIDLLSLKESKLGYQNSYLSNSVVNVNWSLSVGGLLRPCVNLFFLIVLSYEIFTRKYRRIQL